MIRAPVAAESFYPRDAGRLCAAVDRLLEEPEPWPGPRPWGIVVPHAGYRYSGPIAASGYAAARSCGDAIARDRKSTRLNSSHHG